MIEICSKCGNNEWDKEIIEDKLRCGGYCIILQSVK